MTNVKPLNLEKYASSMVGVTTISNMTSATFHNLDASFVHPKVWRSKWETIKCKDGTLIEVLKNPKDAFDAYGSKWSIGFKFLIDIFEKIKFQFDVDVKKEISDIAEMIKTLNNSVQTQLIAAYTTFRSTACSFDSADRLWKMTEDINNQASELMLLIVSTNKIQNEDGVKALKEAVEKLEEIIKSSHKDDTQEDS